MVLAANFKARGGEVSDRRDRSIKALQKITTIVEGTHIHHESIRPRASRIVSRGHGNCIGSGGGRLRNRFLGYDLVLRHGVSFGRTLSRIGDQVS